MKIFVFVGSARKESLNRKLATHVCTRLKAMGVETDHAHIGEFDIPLYHGDWEDENGVPGDARDLKRRWSESDGVVIVSPEYNSSIPGTLKNTIDWMTRPDKKYSGANPFKNKKTALMSATPGYFKGERMRRELCVVLNTLGSMVFGTHVGVAKAGSVFGDDGSLTDDSVSEKIDKALEGFIAELK